MIPELDSQQNETHKKLKKLALETGMNLFFFLNILELIGKVLIVVMVSSVFANFLPKACSISSKL